MRNAFADSIYKLKKKYKNLILLSGDIGNKLFDKFKKKYPNNFYNCGVAENNMVGVAAGLASVGFHPLVYTITPFLTSRSYEQIKIDICYPGRKVIIIGTGSGLSYSRLGVTHHSLDDISLMNSIPDMQIFCPGDPFELEAILELAIRSKKPSYIRLGKKGEPNVNLKKPKISMKSPNLIKKGADYVILSCGNTLKIGSDLQVMLQNNKISTSLYSFFLVKPINVSFLKKIFKKYKKIIVIEEHSKIGGLSSIIKNELTVYINKDNFFCFNIQDKFLVGYGEQNEARKKLGLAADQMFHKLLK
jgi:transketolase